MWKPKKKKVVRRYFDTHMQIESLMSDGDLQYDPVTLLCSRFHGNLSHSFLPLPQGHVVKLAKVDGEAKLSPWWGWSAEITYCLFHVCIRCVAYMDFVVTCHTERLHIFKWVHSRWEDEEHGRGWTTFSERLCKFCFTTFCIFHPKLLLHKIPVTETSQQQSENCTSHPDKVIKPGSITGEPEWIFGITEKCSSLDGIRHAVRSQSSHHDEFLQWTFSCPLLRDLLFLWTLGLHQFLPAFRRAFNVPVQTPKLVSETHHLSKKRYGREWICVNEAMIKIEIVLPLLLIHWFTITWWAPPKEIQFCHLLVIHVLLLFFFVWLFFFSVPRLFSTHSHKKNLVDRWSWWCWKS